MENVTHLTGNHVPGANGATTENPYDFDALAEKDLTPLEIRGIKWRGQEYILKRASADAVIKFNNARFKQAKMDDGRLVGVAGGAELPSLLVSMCLFRVLLRPDKTEQHAPLNEQHVRQNWPPHFIDKLYEDAKRISHIDIDTRTRTQRIKDLRKQLQALEEEEARERRNAGLDEKLVEIGAGDGSALDQSTLPGDAAEDLVGN